MIFYPINMFSYKMVAIIYSYSLIIAYFMAQAGLLLLVLVNYSNQPVNHILEIKLFSLLAIKQVTKQSKIQSDHHLQTLYIDVFNWIVKQ